MKNYLILLILKGMRQHNTRNKIGIGAIAFLSLIFGGSNFSAIAQSKAKIKDRTEISVTDFGAVGDNKTLNTKAIQDAIDACYASGGGRVVIPRGVFVTGTIRLKSHVTLRIDVGAILTGSIDLEDYPTDGSRGLDGTGSLIYAEQAENVNIEGFGIIDGSNKPDEVIPYLFPRQQYAKTFPKRRPMLIRMRDCTNICITDVTLRNPAFFTTFFVGCSDILIDRVNIRSYDSDNGDGLGFDGCERVRISNCDLFCGDDAIALKTVQPNKPNRDFVISNCIISSDWAAVRLGPESFSDMQNIAISNCVFRNCRDGFKIQSCEGAVIENVVISNIIMDNVLRPFFVTLNAFRMSKYSPADRPKVGDFVGELKNLHVSNIRATVPPSSTGKGINQPCVALVGMPGHLIENVTFYNFNLIMPGGGTPGQANRNDIPELISEKRYPEADHFEGELPASVIYLRHLSGVAFTQCRLETATSDARAFIAGNDLDDVSLNGVTGVGFETAPGLIKFADARGVSLHNCRVKIKGQQGHSGINQEQFVTDRPLIVE
ncbi:MAG: glycoside hydrolase family 28 protein [Clostridia bacterium]|nr:glycoside hydrolase family 28 protein [Clostridia bacterium]